MDSLFSGERDAHNTTVPLFIHNCSNTLDLESPPKKKTSNPPEAKEPRQHSISGSKCPAKAQAQTALGCCYPEMFCNANVAACLLHRRTKRFMARERGKQCRVRPTRKGHKSVDLAWPLTGFQARFATGFCSSSGREQEWEVLERSGVSYKMRYCSEWRF